MLRYRVTVALLPHALVALLVLACGCRVALAASTAQCRPGLVWREAFPGDVVCVTPEVRDRTATENAEASLHVAYCKPGYVQRNAARGDRTCVTREEHDLAASENALSLGRTQLMCSRLNVDPSRCPRQCKPGFEHRDATPDDTVCAPPGAKARVAQENARDPRNRNDGPVCEANYVWRAARPGDLVCVNPKSRAEAAEANLAAAQNVDPRVAVCKNYANNAVSQATEYFSRRCGDGSNRWQTSWENHFDFCMGPDGNIIDKEDRARRGVLSQCRTINPMQGAGTPPNPDQGACNVSVVLHNDVCQNADGSPSSYFDPGTYTAVGCGADAAQALAAVKASASQSMLLAESPAPGACTFTTQTMDGCACH